MLCSFYRGRVFFVSMSVPLLKFMLYKIINYSSYCERSTFSNIQTSEKKRSLVSCELSCDAKEEIMDSTDSALDEFLPP